MSSTVPESKQINGLPDDFFDYDSDQFYSFVKQSYGDDLAELFSFQSIRNGLHVLHTSPDDILLILQVQSKAIDKLRNLCCFIIDENRYQVKLGVKLALNNFIECMKAKYAEQNKRKKNRSSAQHLSFSSSAVAIIDQTERQKKTISAQSTELSPSSDDALSTQSRFISGKNKMEAYEHVENIKQRISEWWSNHGDENLSFEHGTNYFLEINRSLNDSYVCVLSCQCRQRFKLAFMTTGLFKLSAFYRHLKEQNCAKSSRTVGFFYKQNYFYESLCT